MWQRVSNRCENQGGRLRMHGLAAIQHGLLIAVCAAGAAVPAAYANGNLIRVEEYWRLVLVEPDTEIDTPQFHTCMSPVGDVDGFYAQVSWNYREFPNFRAGGLQLQFWDNETCIQRRMLESGALSMDAETITWTQQLELKENVLTFRIIDGDSETWGAFGGELTTISAASAMQNLNGYQFQVSVDNSWVTYGMNRVDRLSITRIRYVYDDGTVVEDNTEHVVCDDDIMGDE